QAADMRLLASEVGHLEREVSHDLLLDREIPLLGREVLEFARRGHVQHATGIGQRPLEVVDRNLVNIDRRIPVSCQPNSRLPGRYEAGVSGYESRSRSIEDSIPAPHDEGVGFKGAPGEAEAGSEVPPLGVVRSGRAGNPIREPEPGTVGIGERRTLGKYQ